MKNTSDVHAWDLTSLEIKKKIDTSGHTPRMSFRIPPAIRSKAVERAAAEGETLTAAVVRFLKEYGEGK